ncbi:hypothetical protein ACU635_53375 [[Actinomadura] parvosata]|uniref:hypothetical protein n=1 Tax=[Actinomadura] parvosata TaxID=1955412 RepID=UPI00406C937D
MADIDLLDAWRMWLDGKQIARETWNGWPILYWGRAGKIAAFLGGLTIILDLVGVERLSKVGLQARRLVWRKGQPQLNEALEVLLTVVIIAPVIAVHFAFGVPLVNELTDLPTVEHWGLLAAVFVGEYFAFGLVFTAAGFFINWLFNGIAPGFVARLLATLLLVVGFHFDLLAS